MDQENYLRTRTVSEFLDWIDQTDQCRNNDHQSNGYGARKGLWKKYADEAQPLGRFLRGNTDIPRTATVTMGVQPHLPDASLKIADQIVLIEITTTNHPDDSGRITSAGSTGQYELARLYSQFSKKQKKRYPNPPILIIDLHTPSVEDIEVAQINEFLKKVVTTTPGQFMEIWICAFPGRVFRFE